MYTYILRICRYTRWNPTSFAFQSSSPQIPPKPPHCAPQDDPGYPQPTHFAPPDHPEITNPGRRIRCVILETPKWAHFGGR